MTETRWLSPAEERAWVKFAAVLTLLPNALDAQLARDEDLTHFDYFTLAMLSEAPDRTLRMTSLAHRTNATLARLSRVVGRLEQSGFVTRRPCPDDRRATDVVLTAGGWEKVVQAAPGHVHNVRSLVIDTLTPEDVTALETISGRLLSRLDPAGTMFATGSVGGAED